MSHPLAKYVMSRNLSTLLSALSLSILPCIQSQAQSPGGPPANRPANEYTFSIDSSGSADFENFAGDASVTAWAAGVSHSFAHGTQGARVFIGTEIKRHDISASAGTPLPDTLQSWTLNAAYLKPLNREWSVFVATKPGIFNDDSKASSDALNMPISVFARYSTRPELAWTFGVIGDFFNENPVIPVVGVDWRFSPGWRFNVGFPWIGVGREFGSKWEIRGGMQFQGGSYWVEQQVAPGIRGTLIDYREIRAAIDVVHQLSTHLEIILSVGTNVDRRFDYFDRGFELKGETAGFVTFGLKGRF
jgi:hypothetical protein